MLHKAEAKLSFLFENGGVVARVLQDAADKFDKTVVDAKARKIVMWKHFQAISKGSNRFC